MTKNVVFSREGCEEVGFTQVGLKKHNEEFLSKHLLLIKKKIETDEAKNTEHISQLKNQCSENAKQLDSISKLVDANEKKSNFLAEKVENILNKINKLEQKGKHFIK